MSLHDVRSFHPGMGQAVAERTILRPRIAPASRAAFDGVIALDPKDKHYFAWLRAAHYSGLEVVPTPGAPSLGAPDIEWETWGEVAARVAHGNVSILGDRNQTERATLERHIAKATVLLSGRHLQHGDADQPNLNQEVFTNCLQRDTKVLTLEYGPTAIGSLVGRTVTVRARDGEWRPALVSSHGRQKLYRIAFGGLTGPRSRTPHEVIATANHRWFLRDGSVTDALRVGDVLANPDFTSKADPEAIRHGLIFGDGSAHKRRYDNADGMASQGRDYCAIRLCGEDKKYLAHFEGYPVSYPPSANGDPVVYVGKKRFWKDLPFTTDPEYLTGFIQGWWLADGARTYDRPGIEISTASKEAVDWLRDYAAYAGYRLVGMSTHDRNSVAHPGYANGKTLYSVRLTRDTFIKVRGVEEFGEDEVFCVEEPVTSGFVLANGLLTGNCSTAASSALLFYLLLNGSGVGRSYDDDLMLTDWDYAPELRCVLDHEHPDFRIGIHESARDARHKYGSGRNVIWHDVADSREGWAKAVELFETLAFQRAHSHKLLVLDFSKVRPKGAPIHGMQLRPASGPIPLMAALANVATLKGAGLPAWRQALYADHYLAECVLVGGARRAARMSTKSWRDPDALDFIRVKRPIEYAGLDRDEVIALRKYRAAHGLPRFEAFLWSSNNSITVDSDFWSLKDADIHSLPKAEAKLARHAKKVWEVACECAYADGTGEPGFINVDKLDQNEAGLEGIEAEAFAGFEKYMPSDETRVYLSLIAKAAKAKAHFMIVNPCGEVALFVLGGYCVIADVVPFHADTLEEAADAFRHATRALMRVNLLPSLYHREVRRTNRIGVGMTGVHEFAWKFFRVGFAALTEFTPAVVMANWRAFSASRPELSYDEKIERLRASYGSNGRAMAFWMTLAMFSREVKATAKHYADVLGVAVPHTDTTIKPAGTTSKLFGLTEGWHLPPMAEYLRWVQFRHDDPLLVDYRAKGYPTKDLTTYKGTVIVGFPTRPTIADLGMGDELVLAPDADMASQYRWLQLGERFYIRGVNPDGSPVDRESGNQISYTLKYDPERVSFEEFVDTLEEYQPLIRCCSVMPAEDTSAFEYLPEQAVTKAEYEEIVHAISEAMAEDVDGTHVGCSTGACPVDFLK